MLILGNLDGIETGVRQLIRTTPLETQNVYTHGQKITVPTEAEILRIKGALILKRNATHDYLDFAALSHHIGLKATLDALMRFDDLYPQKNGQSALQQLYLQLANPHPFDLDGLDLSTYKHLSSDWQSWENVAQQCQRIACGIFAAMKKTGNQTTPVRPLLAANLMQHAAAQPRELHALSAPVASRHCFGGGTTFRNAMPLRGRPRANQAEPT